MKTKPHKKKKALLYGRVATKTQDQKPDRLAYQIDTLEIYCQDNNIEVEGIYYEVAGGNSFNRKEFQNLLYDLKAKNVKADLLLFTEWDRFSRNIGESSKMIKKLEAFGIKPQAVKDKTTSIAFYSLLKNIKL